MKIAHRLLNRAGISVTRAPAPLTLAWHLKLVLRQRAVTTVVDVGANDGGFARLLREKVGYGGRIESFEPFPDAFRRLAAAASGDSQWTPHQLALGEQDETADLHVFGSSDMNSLHAARPEASARFPALATSTTVQVPVQRLDSLGLDLGSSVLLKSDTQGHDLAVLRGAKGLLDSVMAVVVELSMVPLYDGTPRWQEMSSFLEGEGFSLIGMTPISRTGLLVNEMDGVFVRR